MLAIKRYKGAKGIFDSLEKVKVNEQIKNMEN